MLIRRPDDIKSSEITPESLYTNRRAFLGTAGALALGTVLAPDALQAWPVSRAVNRSSAEGEALSAPLPP